MVVACVECRCRVRAVMPRLINVEACARATDAGAATATARELTAGASRSQPDPVVRTAAYRSLVLTFECRSHRT